MGLQLVWEGKLGAIQDLAFVEASSKVVWIQEMGLRKRQMGCQLAWPVAELESEAVEES